MNPDYNPQDPNQPQPPNQPQVYGPQSYPPQQQQPPAQGGKSPFQFTEPHNYDDPGSKKTKKILIILGGLVGFLLIFGVIFAIISSGDNSPPETAQEETTPDNLFKEPTAIEIENLNNSASDDITNLSSDADFPATKLSDENLDL